MEIIGNKVIIRNPALLDQLRDQPQELIRLLQQGTQSFSIDQLHVDSSGRVIIENEDLSRSLNDNSIAGLQAYAGYYQQSNSICNELHNNACSGIDNGNCPGTKNIYCS